VTFFHVVRTVSSSSGKNSTLERIDRIEMIPDAVLVDCSDEESHQQAQA